MSPGVARKESNVSGTCPLPFLFPRIAATPFVWKSDRGTLVRTFPKRHHGAAMAVEFIELEELSRLRALLRSGAAASIRTSAGLSLGEVARALGTSKTSVLRWERGDRVPRGDLALAYWRLLRQLMREGGAGR